MREIDLDSFCDDCHDYTDFCSCVSEPVDERTEQNCCLSETCDLAYTEHSDDECNSREECEAIFAELAESLN